MRKKKICHITKDINPLYHYFFGGVPNWIKLVCDEIQPFYDNIYISPLTHYKTPSKNVRVYLLKNYKNFLLNRINFFISVVRILRKEKPIILHLYLLSTFSEFEIYLLKKLFNVKIIATCFNDITTSTILKYQYKLLKRTFLDKIITINNNLKKILKGYRISDNKLITIPTIPNRTFYEIDNNKIYTDNKNELYILFAAGLRKEMGLFYILKEFLQILKKEKKIKFFITYVNNKKNDLIIEKIKSILDEKKISNYFVFKGYISNMKEFLKKIDVLVLPILIYKAKMNTPKMAIETILLEKLVIATPYGGLLELVSNYEDGLLIYPEKNNFANAILNILKNKQLIKELGKRGREKILIKYNFDNVITRIIKLYKSIK